VGLFIHESQHSGEQPNHDTRFSQQTTNFHLVESLHHTRYHHQQSFFNALTLDEARSLKDGFVSVNNGRLSNERTSSRPQSWTHANMHSCQNVDDQWEKQGIITTLSAMTLSKP
jgi:hypothetical protein